MHPVRFEAVATDGAARSGVASHGTRQLPHAVLHAGGYAGCDQVPQCRRLRAARHRDRARQHLSPHAATRCGDRRRTRRSRQVRRMERAHADGLRWLPGVLARAEGRRRRCHLPQHVRRVVAPVDPEIAVHTQELARRRHPDGARRLPTAAVAARRDPSGRRTHRGVGGTGQNNIGVRSRPCSGSCRAGSTSRCAPRALGAPSSWGSTATGSAVSAWARPVARCCRRWPPRCSICRQTAPAT